MLCTKTRVVNGAGISKWEEGRLWTAFKLDTIKQFKFKV